MNNETKKSCCLSSSWEVRVALTAIITALILAAIPIFQMYLIFHYIGVEGFKQYVQPQNNTAFYQFVLTAMGVLAAIAGYLTYKSREEARQEIEKIQKEMQDKKVEFEKHCEELETNAKTLLDSKMKETEEKLNNYSEQLNSALDNALNSMSSAVEKVESKAASHDAAIVRFQLPKFGENDKEREAREYFNEGARAYKNRDYDKEIEAYKKAISLNPNYAIAYNNLGTTKEKKGDIEGAFADYNEAIRLSPEFGIAYSNRSVIWIKKGEFDKAISDCDKAIRLNPNYRSAYYNRACAYALKHDVARCVPDLKKAIELDEKYKSMAQTDKDFDPVRDDPAIKAILG